MSTMEHAKRELEFAGYPANDLEEGPNKWMRENVLALLELFTSQGHSGMSAPVLISLFGKLAAQTPLGPLTGEADEWNEVGPRVWQNRRASSIFKEEDGAAYNIEGIVFWEWYTDEETGERFKTYFTSRDSRVPIIFPYTLPESPEYKEADPNRA